MKLLHIFSLDAWYKVTPRIEAKAVSFRQILTKYLSTTYERFLREGMYVSILASIPVHEYLN